MKKTHKARKKNVIGSRIRLARVIAQPAISQDDLSGKLARLGVTIDRSGISKIESSDRYVMDYEAVAFARALKVSVAWLFGEIEETKPR